MKLHKHWIQLLEKLEGRSIFKYYDEFKHLEYKRFNFLKKRQSHLLKKLVIHAYETVPFYRTKYKDIIGLIKKDLDVYWFKELPFLTRNDIKENFNQMISAKYEKTRLIKYATGGSTGEPVEFLLTKQQYDMRAAISFKTYQMAGWDFMQKTILLSGSPIDIEKFESLKSKIKNSMIRQTSCSSFALTSDKLNKLYNMVMRKKPKAIFGYVSALFLFVEYLAKHNYHVNIPIIIQMAEQIFPEQQKFIEKWLGGEFFKHYGARDAIAIGMECDKRCGMHVNMDTLFVEILRDNKETYDEDGEVVITDLYSYAMPLIRYKIGDVGKWLHRSCTCGRQTPLFDITQGRTASILSTPDGRLVDSLFIPHLFKERAQQIKKYQVSQSDVHHITIKLVKNNGYTVDDESYLRHKLIDKLGDLVGITFNYVDDIPPERSGKYLFVKSKVPVSLADK